MSENEFRRALLRGEEPIDVEAMTYRVLRRDRRRIWILGIVCVIAWMAVVMLPWATVLPMVAKVIEYQAHPAATQPAGSTIELLRIVKTGTVATFFGSIAAMFIAAICTVLLIVLSRRATLRQVNARLAEISARLAVPRPDRL